MAAAPSRSRGRLLTRWKACEPGHDFFTKATKTTKTTKAFVIFVILVTFVMRSYQANTHV